MNYSVHQHWDPLKVCMVGKSYAPEFYQFIENPRVRSVMERIATETEEDYQKLISLLKLFGIEVLRPTVPMDYNECICATGKIAPPPMTPRDYSATINDTFYFDFDHGCSQAKWSEIRGADWPEIMPDDLTTLPTKIKNELENFSEYDNKKRYLFYKEVVDKLVPHYRSVVFEKNVNSAMTTRIGKDLYFGTYDYNQDQEALKSQVVPLFPDYRCHVVNSGGHSDGTFCPVVPGLIVSLYDIPSYAETFPGWEVIYLQGQSWDAVQPFLDLKEKNAGKWWVPGEELNNDFTDFVESWLDHWVGYVEETVFDVNMLVIDQKNVVCNNYNEKVFQAFDRYGITPHVVNFRHRYFWDGGLHCITLDLHREGTLNDYFPERG